VTVGGADSTCAAAGATTVVIAATPASGPVVTGTFPCADQSATTDSLPAGRYTVDVQLRDAGGHTLADDPVGRVDVGAGTTDLGHLGFALPASGPGAVAASWQITLDGSAATCADLGATTFEIEIDPDGGGAPIVDTAGCSAGSLTVSAVGAGGYGVKARLRDKNGDPLAHVTVAGVTVPSGGTKDLGTQVFDVPVASGRIGLTWTLYGQGAPVSCADVGAVTVVVDATAATSKTTTSDAYDCTLHIGTTEYLADDDYTVVVRLLDANGAELTHTDVAGSVPVVTDWLTDIGDVELDL
jgi:hypothetical protein